MSLPESCSIRNFDINKDYETLEYLYPEFVKNSNLENYSFFYYLKNLLIMLQEQSVVLYTITENETEKVTGFMLGEEIFPYIINVHIVIKKDYRNIFNTIKCCKMGINKLKDLNIKQIVASISTENRNAFLLLKKLGFAYLGYKQEQYVFSMIIN